MTVEEIYGDSLWRSTQFNGRKGRYGGEADSVKELTPEERAAQILRSNHGPFGLGFEVTDEDRRIADGASETD